MQVYLVGGAVRDSLLGLPVRERDWVVVGATAEQLVDRGYGQVDQHFPVYRHPDTGDEYALARREVKTGPGHKGFRVDFGPDVTLEEDLARRDLRVNAIARGEDGALVDPFDGVADLEARVLRHVTPAFVEDPLRVLRAARFAATLAPLGFELSEDTLALMTTMSSGEELATLSGPRIWRELGRAMGEGRATRFVEVLARCGALERLLPGSGHGAGVEHAIDALARCADGNCPVIAGAAALAYMLVPEAPRDAAARLGAPAEVLDLCTLLAEWGPGRAVLASRAAEALLGLVEGLDAFRRPCRLERYADALRIASNGDADVCEALGRLVAAREVAAALDARALLSQGLSGRALGEALRSRRVEAIAETLGRPLAGGRGS